MKSQKRRGMRPVREASIVSVEVSHPAVELGSDMVLLGEFGRPHGLNGEIRLKSYTADPLAIASYGVLTTSGGGQLTLQSVRSASGSSPDLLVVRVAEVRDRSGAEALNRVTLHCPRERLGVVEDEDEFFTSDLIGVEAVDAAGVLIGQVVGVPNFGGGDLLEIRPAAGGASALMPFTKAFVPELDLARRRIVISPPDDFFAPPGPRPAEDKG